MRKSLHWLATGVFLLFALPVTGGGARTGFLNRVFKGEDGPDKYVLFVPHGYKGDTAYPLILFLHGAGQTGSDGLEQAKLGIGAAIKKKEKAFPFFVVFPQAHTKGWQAEGPNAKRALAILAEIQKEYKIDGKRIYLTGLSMGGSGTWSLAAKYPGRWAAIVPICGKGAVKHAGELRDLPCWCFIGDKDKAVQNNRDMIAALKSAGAAPRYTEYPGVGHNSWDRAYATEELYTWLLKHKLK
jgi:predicted peptidase